MPLFVVLILIASDMASLTVDGRKITSNYMSKSTTINLSDIGIKHAKILETSLNGNKTYYINIVDESIMASDSILSDKYACINIKISKRYESRVVNGQKKMITIKDVNIDSTGIYKKFSNTKKVNYIIENNT
ncbi:MAG: hypothetical protein RR898_00845 [Clostridium sp.]|uniref:hypothetical protein n=1 Tax=Clostridium sp. TaxID=1506 RepID=UPI002FC9760D